MLVVAGRVAVIPPSAHGVGWCSASVPSIPIARVAREGPSYKEYKNLVQVPWLMSFGQGTSRAYHAMGADTVGPHVSLLELDKK